MKTKLSLLISSITTIALVLVVALSQSTTNSIGAIHELTVTEMEAITGTGVCDQPKNLVATWCCMNSLSVEIIDCGT